MLVRTAQLGPKKKVRENGARIGYLKGPANCKHVPVHCMSMGKLDGMMEFWGLLVGFPINSALSYLLGNVMVNVLFKF
jgi:hypothetical protein